MFYLIKSLKWTKHWKIATYYGHNSCGYTHNICDAGIYTDEDMNEPANQEGIERKVISFIPIDKKIIKLSEKQVSKYIKEVEKVIARLENTIKNEKVLLDNTKTQSIEKINKLKECISV